MDAGHVNVILGEAEDKGLRGSINLVGGAKISFDFNGIGIETSFNCNTKNRTLMIGSGSTVVFTRKYIVALSSILKCLNVQNNYRRQEYEYTRLL